MYLFKASACWVDSRQTQLTVCQSENQPIVVGLAMKGAMKAMKEPMAKMKIKKLKKSMKVIA